MQSAGRQKGPQPEWCEVWRWRSALGAFLWPGEQPGAVVSVREENESMKIYVGYENGGGKWIKSRYIGIKDEIKLKQDKRTQTSMKYCAVSVQDTV